MKLIETIRTTYGEFDILRSDDRVGYTVTDRLRMHRILGEGFGTIDRARTFIRHMTK